MKYYCENCGSVFEPGEDIVIPVRTDGTRLVVCPVCTDFEDMKDSGVYFLMKPLPEHETVAQWEARKGRKYPDTAPAYIMDCRRDHIDWFLVEFEAWRSEFTNIAIVATEAGAPPKTWRPE